MRQAEMEECRKKRQKVTRISRDISECHAGPISLSEARRFDFQTVNKGLGNVLRVQ